jgi:hypothetical protein
LVTALIQSTAMAGRISRGGDPTGLEFTQCASSAIAVVQKDTVAYPELKGVDLDTILDNAIVLVTDDPLPVEKNGVEQDSVAINYRAPETIVINRSRWDAIATLQIKNAVALHEILGLAGIEDTGVYTISQRYLNSLGTPCTTGVCSNEIANSAFNVLSPSNGASVSGMIQVSGQAGSEWVNVAIYENYAKISSDFSPLENAYSIAIDTTKLADGPHHFVVVAFTLAPGLLGGTTTDVNLDVVVQNHTH